MSRLIRSLAIMMVVGLLFTSIANAQQKVDSEIVFLVDSSGSVSDSYLLNLRRSIITALNRQSVIEQIDNNFHQQIAISIIDYANDPIVVVPWVVIKSKDDIDAVLRRMPSDRMTRGSTQTFSALLFAARYLDNGITSTVQHIDLMTDGKPDDTHRQVEYAQTLDPLLNVHVLLISDQSSYLYNISEQYAFEHITHGPLAMMDNLSDENFSKMIQRNLLIPIM